MASTNNHNPSYQSFAEANPRLHGRDSLQGRPDILNGGKRSSFWVFFFGRHCSFG